MPNVCVGADCVQKAIKVYTREGCGYCDKLKPQVLELKAEHPEIDINIVDETEAFKAGKGRPSYPTSIGYDEHGQQLREVKGCPPSGAKEYILSALQNKTVADFSVVELVLMRDEHMTSIRVIEAELSKRK